MTLPVARIRQAFDGSPLQWKLACRGLSRPPEENGDLTLDDCFLLWVFLLLQRLKFLTAEQRLLLYEQLAETIREQPDSFPPQTKADALLVVGDGRYATWTGLTGWLDLHTGEQRQNVPAPVLESVAYNLATLFSRNVQACFSPTEAPHGKKSGRPSEASKRVQR